MSRFFPLSAPKEGSRFANLAERLNEPLPGEPLYGKNSYEPPLGGTSKRLEAFRKQTAGTSPVVPATTKPKAVAPVAIKPTAAELVAKAKAEARAKVVAVKAASVYKGREATARKMLLSGKQSAAQIIKALASSPTDAQLAAVDRHMEGKAADKAWSRAYGLTSAPNATEGSPERQTGAAQYDELWTRARSRPPMARSDLP